MPDSLPIILCLSGHDPTGGAGLQADIETLGRLGCHASTVVTALTVQDSRDVVRVLPQAPADLLEQARWLVRDLPLAAVKIGLLGSAGVARAVAELLRALPGVPVVLDPVLAAGGGTLLAREDLIEVLCGELLPLVSVLTPNIPEAEVLSGERQPEACAKVLLQMGARHVLITGTHDEGSEKVINRLFGPEGDAEWAWGRLPHSYHGSGCTLASALAGYLAQGLDMRLACERAQVFTWEALAAGWRPSKGQHFPRRCNSLG